MRENVRSMQQDARERHCRREKSLSSSFAVGACNMGYGTDTSITSKENGVAKCDNDRDMLDAIT